MDNDLVYSINRVIHYSLVVPTPSGGIYKANEATYFVQRENIFGSDENISFEQKKPYSMLTTVLPLVLYIYPDTI